MSEPISDCRDNLSNLIFTVSIVRPSCTDDDIVSQRNEKLRTESQLIKSSEQIEMWKYLFFFPDIEILK